MFGNLHEWAVELLALVLMGSAIKLMDDQLDAEYDICRGERTLAVKLGRALLPYTLVLTVLALYLQPVLTTAVFFGSYAVGMFTRWQEKLPTRVPAYVEIFMVIGLSMLLTGWQTAVWGLTFMALVDWVDDLTDATLDKVSGQDNLVLRIGWIETSLLVLLVLCVAVLLNFFATATGLIALAMLTILSELTTAKIWQGEDNNKNILG
ncbi:hypothetical protein D2Q93_00150 [Alicyclobacillaceae bacterium I2511]|nr:hypothetical protein D2Q93_00150 [Alicyclobacillaceae bacterium I2511]